MAQEDDDQKTEGLGEEASEGTEAPKKGMSFLIKVMLVLLLASISLVGGLVATAGLDGVKNLIAGSSEKSADEVHHDAEPEEAKPSYGIMNLDEMIVNIVGVTATGRTTTRFLKIKVSIVYDEALGEPLLSRGLFLRDAFQDYLRQVNERDLAGSIGLATLKSELLKRAKSIAGNQAPESVLIGDLIIQ